MMFIYLVSLTTLLVIIDGVNCRIPRIANGIATTIESYPYMASIRSDGYHNCGGTIISKNVILTAGHCAPERTAKIHVGMNSSLETGTEHSVDKVIRHENYRREFVPGVRSIAYNDIALVKVKPAFVFNETFRPVALFNADEELPGGSAGIALGWGDVSLDEHISYKDQTVLRSVKIPIFDKKQCASVHKKDNYTVKPGELCAGGNGKGVCMNDSGGPLIVNGQQAGIASWMHGYCGQANDYISMFTEVSHFRRWVDENLEKLEKNDDNNGYDYIEGSPIWD